MDKMTVELTIDQMATVLAALDAGLKVCRDVDNVMALTDAKVSLLSQIGLVI